MAKHIWSEAEEGEIRRHFAAGLSHREIALAMGHSKFSVTSKLERLGLRRVDPVSTNPPRREERQRAGKVTLPPLASLSDE